LKKAAFHLKLYCGLLLVFSVASILIFQQWGFVAATLVAPIGFYAAWTCKRWMALLFLALNVVDFLVLFIYGIVVNTTHGSLFVAVEFTFLLVKIWAAMYSYRFWQRLPEAADFFSRFEGADRIEINVGSDEQLA